MTDNANPIDETSDLKKKVDPPSEERGQSDESPKGAEASEAEEPEQEEAEPPAQAEGVAKPAEVEVTEPEVEVTKPEVEVMEQEVEVMEPEVEVTKPAESEPDVTVSGQEAEPEETENGEDPAPAEPEQVEEPEEDPLETARAETRRVRDQLLRVAADFENFRKRSRREIEDGARRAREELLRELLPVFDNLARASTHAEQAEDINAVASGVKMVLKQFEDTLGKLGIARVPSQGEVFDPTVHEAIQQLETPDAEPGTVVAEVLSGYTWGERLLRAAMVVVAKAPPPEPVEEEPTE